MKFPLTKIKKSFNFNLVNPLNINSDNGWVILLMLFIFLNLINIVFNLNLYFQIDKGEIFPYKDLQGVSINLDLINKSDLLDIISSFEEKKKDFLEFQELKSSKLIDPSL